MSAESYPPPKKRKENEEKAEAICIVHTLGLNDYGEIKLLSSVDDPNGRFEKLLEIKRRRLAQPLNSAYRMENVCTLLPEVLQDNDGYHPGDFIDTGGNADFYTQNSQEKSQKQRTGITHKNGAFGQRQIVAGKPQTGAQDGCGQDRYKLLPVEDRN